MPSLCELLAKAGLGLGLELYAAFTGMILIHACLHGLDIMTARRVIIDCTSAIIAEIQVADVIVSSKCRKNTDFKKDYSNSNYHWLPSPKLTWKTLSPKRGPQRVQSS